MLTSTRERFKIPRDVYAICIGKSSYARCGLIVNVTPLQPEFEGQVTIEVSNTTTLPARIYAGEGLAAFVFFRGEPPNLSYKEQGGRYMGQSGVTPVRIER